MTTVTVYTAERMQEIEDQAVIGGSIIGGHLILERNNGETIDAGAIDVTVIGNFTYQIDTETYYRYTDAASPVTLVADIYTPISDALMDLDDGNPSWGHWDTSEENKFIFDIPGLYDVFTYAVLDSGAAVPGQSAIKITDTAVSGDRAWSHLTGVDVRVENQMTNLYEAGQSVRIDVLSSAAIDVTYAEIYIRRLIISIDDSVIVPGGPGGGGPQTPWESDIDAADYALLNVGPIESNVDVVAATGATQTLDASAYGVFDVTMDANCTFAFSNPPASGTATRIMVVVKGAFTPTWPGSVDWNDGTVPTYEAPSVYTFHTVNGGTTWYGFMAGSGMA